MRRETRVALSLRAQPLWFRLLKWVVIVTLGVLLWRTPWFWHFVVGGVIVGCIVHLVWRWGTHGWTRPWGGWKDLEAGRRD